MTKKLFTVFGSFIQHSKSPFIHQAFAKQFSIDLNYTITESTAEQLESQLKEFRESGGFGANITAPLKEVAFKLCDKVTSSAKEAHAVNTLYWDSQGRLCGDNTDGFGFLRDIQHNYHQDLTDKSILLLGAGGAASGLLGVILAETPKEIVLANRTKERAEQLAARFNDSKVIPLSYDTLNLARQGHHFDIVINATSASLHDQIPGISEQYVHNAFVYDLMYNLEKPTVFVHWALRHHARDAVDGLGMLLEQAAGAFYIWHQKQPETEQVKISLKEQYEYESLKGKPQ